MERYKLERANIQREQLVIDPFNARTLESREATGLFKTIEKEGILYPLKVRKLPKGKYGIFDGVTRFLSSKSKVFECDVYDLTDEQTLRYSASLNLEQYRISPMDLALNIQRYERLTDKRLSLRELAEIFPVSREMIRLCKKLLKLPKETQNKVLRGELSFRKALGLTRETTDPRELAQSELGTEMLRYFSDTYSPKSKTFFEVTVTLNSKGKEIIEGLAKKYNVAEDDIGNFIFWRVIEKNIFGREISNEDVWVNSLTNWLEVGLNKRFPIWKREYSRELFKEERQRCTS